MDIQVLSDALTGTATVQKHDGTSWQAPKHESILDKAGVIAVVKTAVNLVTAAMPDDTTGITEAQKEVVTWLKYAFDNIASSTHDYRIEVTKGIHVKAGRQPDPHITFYISSKIKTSPPGGHYEFVHGYHLLLSPRGVGLAMGMGTQEERYVWDPIQFQAMVGGAQFSFPLNGNPLPARTMPAPGHGAPRRQSISPADYQEHIDAPRRKREAEMKATQALADAEAAAEARKTTASSSEQVIEKYTFLSLNEMQTRSLINGNKVVTQLGGKSITIQFNNTKSTLMRISKTAPATVLNYKDEK